MAREKRGLPGRIRLARLGVGLGCDQLLIKRLGRADRKYWQVHHRRSPEFSVGQRKLKPQTPHGIRLVVNVGLPAAEREAADHGHFSGLKHKGFRETDAFPIAFKEPGDTQALGMVATKTGVDAVDFLETVDEPRGRQFLRRQPTAEIGIKRRDRGQGDANKCESCHRTGCNAGRPGFRWRLRGIHDTCSPACQPSY